MIYLCFSWRTSKLQNGSVNAQIQFFKRLKWKLSKTIYHLHKQTEALILMGEATTASIAISYDVNFKFQYLISIISKHKTFKNQYTSRLSQHLCKSDFVYLTLCLLIARTSIGSCTSLQYHKIYKKLLNPQTAYKIQQSKTTKYATCLVYKEFLKEGKQALFCLFGN